MVNSYRLSLAMHRVANGFTPYLVGGTNNFKKLYRVQHSTTKIDNNWESIYKYSENILNQCLYFQGNTRTELKDLIKDFNFSGDKIKYFVVAYSINYQNGFTGGTYQTNHFTAIKLIYDDNGEIFVDENSVSMYAGNKNTSGEWFLNFLFPKDLSQASHLSHMRSSFSRNLIKSDLSKLYAPFYYNVIDTLPKGMSNDFQKNLGPAIEEWLEKSLKI